MNRADLLQGGNAMSNAPAKTAKAVRDAIPEFKRDFDTFLDYLNDGTSRAVISPRRFAQVFSFDMQTLAAAANVHRNTVSRAPESESIQVYLRASVRVLRAAVDVAGSIDKAIYWYRNHPLPIFDYKTAQQLVSEGRTDDVVRYLQSLQAGFAG
jgi:murein L,D-transpeptidase YcbB/YkuD